MPRIRLLVTVVAIAMGVVVAGAQVSQVKPILRDLRLVTDQMLRAQAPTCGLPAATIPNWI